MKSRTFTAQDQSALAQLSGDYNPLHLDPAAARRLGFGSPVVPGIHSLLWALDAWLENRSEPIQIRSDGSIGDTAFDIERFSFRKHNFKL